MMYQASGVLTLTLHLLRQPPALASTSVLCPIPRRTARLRLALARVPFSTACYLMVPPWLQLLLLHLHLQVCVTLLVVPYLHIGLNQNRNLRLDLTLLCVVPRHPAQEIHPLCQRQLRKGFSTRYYMLA